MRWSAKRSAGRSWRRGTNQDQHACLRLSGLNSGEGLWRRLSLRGQYCGKLVPEQAASKGVGCEGDGQR